MWSGILLTAVTAIGYFRPDVLQTLLPSFFAELFHNVGECLQKKWELLLDSTTDDPYTLYTYGKLYFLSGLPANEFF